MKYLFFSSLILVFVSCQSQKVLRKTTGIWKIEKFVADKEVRIPGHFKYFELEFCHSEEVNNVDLIISDFSNLPEFANGIFSVTEDGDSLEIDFLDNPDPNLKLKIISIAKKELELEGIYAEESFYIKAVNIRKKTPKIKSDLIM